MDDPWASVRDALKQCARAPMWARSSRELVDGLDLVQVLASQLTALGLELLREIDARGIPTEQGAANTTAWMRDRYRLFPGTASRQVKLAAALDRELPATAAALADGSLNPEQVEVIAKAVLKLPAQHRADGETFLVGHCAQFGPKELVTVTDHLLDVVAPELAEEAAKRMDQRERRAYTEQYFHLTDIDGRVRLSGSLDRESAAFIRAAIDPLCAPRSTPNGEDLRTPGHRRADALVDVCKLATACEKLPDNGGDRPQIMVTVDIETLRQQIGAATLDDGTLLSPAAARRLACDARILPAIMNGKGQVLDAGRERRLFTGPIRSALVLRDRGCSFPGCDRPPRWCDGHHVISWLDGGPTNLSNAVLLCGHHHRVIHQGRWQVRIAADGLPEFTPPPYIDPEQQPRRNTYHRRQ